MADNSNKRLRSSYLSTVISISLVLFMIGLLGLLVLDSKKLTDYVKEHVQLNVFLNDGLSQPEVDKLVREFYSLNYVRDVRYISKEEALDSLKKSLGESAVTMIENNPLPASLDINLRAEYAHPDSLKLIKESLTGNKMIKEVMYQQSELDKINQNFRTLGMVILIFCGLLFFIAIVLINNTIRLAMYSKRFLIKSMQLVGATKNFIRKPFLAKGLAQGIYAGFTSIVLLSGIIYMIENEFPELGQLSDLNMLAVLFGALIVLGLLLSGISTFFAVNRYLRQHIDELY